MDGWGRRPVPGCRASQSPVPRNSFTVLSTRGDGHMALLRSWRRIFGRQQRQVDGKRGKALRPQLEALEDRVVPTNWFVSTLGVDDLAHGSPGAPFRSLQFAVNVAQSGDRIHVA